MVISWSIAVLLIWAAGCVYTPPLKKKALRKIYGTVSSFNNHIFSHPHQSFLLNGFKVKPLSKIQCALLCLLLLADIFSYALGLIRTMQSPKATYSFISFMSESFCVSEFKCTCNRLWWILGSQRGIFDDDDRMRCRNVFPMNWFRTDI